VAEQERKSAVESLVSTCDAIAKGQFDDMDGLFSVIADETVGDDIRALAESFASMAVQIEAREFHTNKLIDDLKETQRQLQVAQQQLKRENTDLRERLKKLDVDYDKVQAEREIEEIVDSDYFRDLQNRAKSMRTKFKTTSQT
jgi:regulator of replication initiation timing